jgi:hypothetical protein
MERLLVQNLDGPLLVDSRAQGLSFPKNLSARIRAMRQNQRIIRRDVCDPPAACDVCRQPVQVEAPA